MSGGNLSPPFFEGVGGDFHTPGLWTIWEGVRSAGAINMPSYNVGDLLVVCLWDIGLNSLASTGGGWTRLSGGSEWILVRIADGTAADTYTLGALASNAIGGSQMISLPTAYTTLGSKFNGGTFTGSPSNNIQYPAQALAGSGASIIVSSGKRVSGPFVNHGPYSTPGVDGDLTYVGTNRAEQVGVNIINMWWGYLLQPSTPAAMAQASYNFIPVQTGPLHGQSFRQLLS